MLNGDRVNGPGMSKSMKKKAPKETIEEPTKLGGRRIRKKKPEGHIKGKLPRSLRTSAWGTTSRPLSEKPGDKLLDRETTKTGKAEQSKAGARKTA